MPFQYLNRRFGFLDPNQPIITGKLRQIFIATTAERDFEIGTADVPFVIVNNASGSLPLREAVDACIIVYPSDRIASGVRVEVR